MVVQLLLWILFFVLILIIPVRVFGYYKTLRYKKNEVGTILAGGMGKRYLNAYYPESVDEKKGVEDHTQSEERLNKIINEFFQHVYHFWNFLLPVITLICITGIGLFFFLSEKYHLVVFCEKELKFLGTIPDFVYFGFFGAFISGFVGTYRRYHNMDLTPSFLYSINAKILICSVLGYL